MQAAPYAAPTHAPWQGSLTLSAEERASLRVDRIVTNELIDDLPPNTGQQPGTGDSSVFVKFCLALIDSKKRGGCPALVVRSRRMVESGACCWRCIARVDRKAV
jgi:hypothetical protein